MRILLIDPPGKNKGLNTGLAYLSAALGPRHTVRVLDLNNLEVGFCGDPNPDLPAHRLEQRIVRDLDRFEPELVGISVKTFTAEISSQVINVIRERMPRAILVAGGPHLTLDGVRFLTDNRVDFGIRGEAERSLPVLCEALVKRMGLEEIKGLIAWKNSQIVATPVCDSIEALDSLPLPRYDNFSSIIENGGLLREYPLLTSRGCPYKCSYCSMPKIMGNKWRFREPAAVIGELREARGSYGSTSFTVVDDNFTLKLDRVDTICDLLISEKLDLPWNSQNGIRADRVSAPLAVKMKRSGCRYVWIGVESADDKVFNAINKGETLADIRRGIGNLKAAGIRVGGFFIAGLPYSTKKSDLKMIDFVRQCRMDAFLFNFVPYPDTAASTWVENNGRILRPSLGALQFGSNGIDPVFETDDYSRTERISAFQEINIRLGYYDRLVDPSLRQAEKWPRVYRIVRPYGPRYVAGLLTFIARYNLQMMKKRIPALIHS